MTCDYDEEIFADVDERMEFGDVLKKEEWIIPE